MKALAEKIYNNLLDMDFTDYEETIEADLENLLNDLKLLEQQGCGALINAIEIIVNE